MSAAQSKRQHYVRALADCFRRTV